MTPVRSAWQRTLLGAGFVVLTNVPYTHSQTIPFVIYYAHEAASEAFDPYSLVVLDGSFETPIRALKARGARVLGYLSLGEVAEYRAHYRIAAEQGLLLHPNPQWPDSSMVDLRKDAWAALVTEVLVPEILDRGFDGLLLDTLDNAAYLESVDRDRFHGMTGAAIRLVRAIRERYPDTLLMMNRAYELLPALESEIDIELGESVRTDYDFGRRSYTTVDEATYREQVDLLQAAGKRRPELQILTIDYWDPSDRSGVASIYRAQRANGFHPYVATVELDRIVPEPRP